MPKRLSILPTASDGLAPAQRAVLRYLFANPEPPNCAAIVKELLSSRGCPGDVGSDEIVADAVSARAIDADTMDAQAIDADSVDARANDADAIDAAILMMSHPALCHTPLLTYHGSFGFEGGWLPGPVYRTVRLSPALIDLLAEAPASDDLADPWSPRPLQMRYPIALLHGSPSWRIEIDERLPPEKWDQRERRVRCDRIHTLAAFPAAIDRAAQRYRQTGNVADCITRLGEDGPPIGCCTSLTQFTDAFACESWLQGQLDNAKDGALPHGVLLGFQPPGDTTADCGYELLSLPVLQYVCPPPTDRRFLIVRQPACGRCIGDEVELLCRVLGAKHVMQTKNKSDAAGNDEAHDAEELAGVVELPRGGADQQMPERLVAHIALEPMPMDAYAAMLSRIG